MKINKKLLLASFVIALIWDFATMVNQFSQIGSRSDISNFVAGFLFSLIILTLIVFVVLAVVLWVLRKTGAIK